MNPRRLGALLIALVLAVFPARGLLPARGAELYPTRVVTILVPFPAGGPTDMVGRLLAQALGQALDAQFIIENIGGSGGVLGATRAARATPDGYTLLLHNIGLATSPALYRRLPYDPRRDFAPIGLVNEAPMTLVARRDLAVTSLAELIAYAKARKDGVTFANAGIGGASHLCGLLFMSAIATQLTTVPYKGTGPAMNDLLGGQVDLLCDQTTNTVSHITAGKIIAFAVTSRSRVAALPELPTMAEAGLPGMELAIWHGLFAPKGTPEPIIDRLAAALRQALESPMLRERFAALGATPALPDEATPEALRRHLDAEIGRWSPIIEAAGAYAD